MVFLEDLGRRGPSTVERGISKTLLIVRGYPLLPEKWPSPCVRPKKITMIARERTAATPGERQSYSRRKG
jgi:hypothetical protein